MNKVEELNAEIKMIENQIVYTNSMISVLMAEANLCDLQIMEFTASGLKLKEKIRDLQAELKDTI